MVVDAGENKMTVDNSHDINDNDNNDGMHPKFAEYDTDSESNFDSSNSDLSHIKSAFDQTTDNLVRLGSISLDRFRSLALNEDDDLNNDNDDVNDNSDKNGSGDMDVDVSFVLGGGGGGNQLDTNIDIASVNPSDAPKVLRDLARRFFGNSKSAVRTEPIKYEILEERAPTTTTTSAGESAAVSTSKYSCILTIFRPTGSSRSYRTKADSSKRSEAKAAAAHLALRLGALEFIKNGDKTRDRIHLVPLGRLGAGSGLGSGPGSSGTTTKGFKTGEDDHELEERDSSGDTAIIEIENCCTEWRSGTVHPQWIHLTDNRFIGSFGCALKISLSAHVQRAYSIVPGLGTVSYPTKSHAKSACAKLAIEEGVLDFIKHGDGLEQPVSFGSGSLGMDRGENLSVSGGVPFAPAATVLTLQSFYELLPKPMPDLIGTKLNGDFNAISWLNNMIQITKGSRMSSSFHWFTDAKVGLYGCLLRLTRPDGPSKTYMVDASFSKRSDAKIAVCLWACSQGLGTYVRQVSTEIDSLVTPEMRRRCAEELLPSLGRALHKIRPGVRAEFACVCDIGSFNCVMTIDLSTIVDTTNTNTTNDVSVSSAPVEVNSTGSPSTPESSSINVNEEDPSLETSNSPIIPAISLPSTQPSNKTWTTRTKYLYKSRQDAKVAAVYLAFEEGVMQWVEKYQGQGRSEDGGSGSGGSLLGEGKSMAPMSRFGSRKNGFGFAGRGGRKGFERGNRGQGFGRGSGRGRGRGGFFGGYAHTQTRSGSGSDGGFRSAESGHVVANSTNIESNADATMMNVSAPREGGHVELEEGEMIDGGAVNTNTKGNFVATGNGMFRDRGKREARMRAPRGGGLGFKTGRGRGGGVAAVPPIQPTQHTQQPPSHPNSRSQVAPHINPRFFPHINGVPASSLPSYPPPAPQPPPDYEYDAYAYVFPSEASVQPGYDYQHGPPQAGRYGGEEEYQQYPYQSDPRNVHAQAGNSQRSQFFHYQVQKNSVSSEASGKDVTQQRPTAPNSAHYKRQLDTADAASNAVSEPQLVLSSVDADNGRVGLGEGDVRDKEQKGEVVGNNSKGVKGEKNEKGDGVAERSESDLRKAITNGKKQISERASGRVPTGVIPSGPRADRNRAHKLGPDTMAPPPYYPPELDYSPTQQASPPFPGYQTDHYQYPYPYQQPPPPPPPVQLPYQTYDNYDPYYPPPDALPPPVPQIFNTGYMYPGHPGAGPYPPTHLHQGYPAPQPDPYTYPTRYASQSTVQVERNNGPAPPIGPRAMLLSRNQLPSGPQSEGRQPPSAPRAMMMQASQQQQPKKRPRLSMQGMEPVNKRPKVQASS